MAIFDSPILHKFPSLARVKLYVTTTGIIFGLLTLAHLWRIGWEEHVLATDPFFVAFTAIAAGLCVWAFVVRGSH